MENLAVNNFLALAKRIGVSSDQIYNFLSHAYVPFPWQLNFHLAARSADLENGAVKLGIGGARGPGKSHATFAQITLDDCQRFK